MCYRASAGLVSMQNDSEEVDLSTTGAPEATVDLPVVDTPAVASFSVISPSKSPVPDGTDYGADKEIEAEDTAGCIPITKSDYQALLSKLTEAR